MLLFNASAFSSEIVILAHGIFRSSVHMEPLAEFLESHGYEVINLDYPSTKHSLEELIEIASTEINHQVKDTNRTINFVGYSMGGLLVRGIIAKHRPEHLGRVVLMGTPNSGSEVADFLQDNILYQKLYGPAGQQLTTQTKLSELFGPVDYELGVIAGNFSIDLISSAIIPGDDDGKVSVASTKVSGMKDFIVISASHTFFPSNHQAQHEVLVFLKEGHFDHH